MRRRGSSGLERRATTATGASTATCSSSSSRHLPAGRSMSGAARGAWRASSPRSGMKSWASTRRPACSAAAREAAPEMELHIADAAELPFADTSFELVVAFMSFQDVDDLSGALREAARVLVPGGRLCLAIVHPLNSAGSFESRTADSPFVIEGSYLGEAVTDADVRARRPGHALRQPAPAAPDIHRAPRGKRSAHRTPARARAAGSRVQRRAWPPLAQDPALPALAGPEPSSRSGRSPRSRRGHPDGSFATSTVARAGGCSPTCFA